MSAQACGKKYATPLPFTPSPHPSPHRTHHPSTNCPGPMISGLLDHVISSANGCGAPGPCCNPFRSAPPPAQCRQNRLYGIAFFKPFYFIKQDNDMYIMKIDPFKW